MKSARFALLALALALMIPFAAMAAPAHQPANPAASHSLSGQCNYQTDGPWVSGNVVYVDAQLWCSVSHTRQVEVCVVAAQPGSDTQWHCYTGPSSYGTSFFQSNVFYYTYPADNWTFNVWFWFHDYSNGESWSGYGSYWHRLGVGAYGYA